MSSNEDVIQAGDPNGGNGEAITSNPAAATVDHSSSSSSTISRDDQGEAKVDELPKTKVLFNSQDFLNFLTTKVDIANLMVETKDGERFKASFPGSSISSNGGYNKNDHEPPMSVFKSLDMLKGMGMVDGDPDPTVLQSTVSLEYFPPNPCPIARAPTGTTTSGARAASASAFASREWISEYKNSHIDVTYDTCFTDPKTGEVVTNTANGASMLPPKKRAAAPNVNGNGNTGDDHWNDMFKRALAPLVNVAVAQREQGPSVPSPTPSAKRSGRRKPRKIIPEVKNYCDFTEKDVLFGRGGRSNHHPGNKMYREIVTEQQDHYRSCDKNEKTKVAQGIVDHMQKEVGARFLELDKETNRWYLVPNVVARRKVGQALRENNTEEARAAKRAKYQGRYSTIATKKAAEVNAAAAANLATRPSVSSATDCEVPSSNQPHLSAQV
ncbi:hypothetical protein IV203_006090 [Nitzschia inconspicua]|uniref:DUF6824 domain-containing protein n=1 Tax=Nitzschia inconspicua TaxID=303405 RepID=A0A9K3PHJ8_9STRA|nr:hypothetical protein IV203_006090 [Nitzschia inconspicua]